MFPYHRARMICLLGFLAGLTWMGELRAGVIVGHTANGFDATYDRFSNGYPAAPVPNTSPSFVGAPYDLSGIGWLASAPSFSTSLVSPRHILGAAHVGYSPGSQIQFYDRINNLVRSYTIQSVRIPTTTYVDSQAQSRTLPSDVALITLTAPIPASHNINFFPVASGSPGDFLGRSMLAYGQNPDYGPANRVHLGLNTIANFELSSFNPDPVTGDPRGEATQVATFTFNASSQGNIYLIGGDSGSPSFVTVGGQLAQFGIHYGVSNPTLNPVTGDVSADSFVPYYINQLNSMMALDTDVTHPTGYTLTLVPVPEPGTWSLLALAALSGAAIHRRREARTAHA